MDQGRLIRRLKLQIRIYQSVIVLGALAALVWWGHAYFASRPYAITVDGRLVAYLSTERQAREAIDRVKRTVSGVKPSEVTFAQAVTICRGSRGARPVPQDKAAEALLSKVSFRVKKYAILLDGVPAVAVDSKQVAGDVLEAAKMKFGSLTRNLMEEPSFKQKVGVERREVDPALYRPTVEDALEELLSGGGGGDRVYTAASGDMASKIAERYSMTLTELSRLNPGKDLDRLQIGDRLRVADGTGPAKPRLAVLVRDKSTGTEPVPYTTETVSSVRMFTGRQVELSPGRDGLREVVRAETYENGVRTGSEVVEERVIRSPVPRRVAVGIRRRG